MSSGKGVGRPKKNKRITKDNYKGILKEHPNKNLILEFVYSAPLEFKRYWNTLKSCNVSEIYVEATKNSIKFYGNTEKKKYCHDEVIEPDALYMCINNCDDIYSYYCREESFIFSINNTSDNVNYMLDEIQESSEFFKIIAEDKSPSYLTIEVYNSILKLTNRFDMYKTVLNKEEVKFNKLPRNTETYCDMLNIDISECKKNIKTKFKKNVSEADILIYGNCIEYNYKKTSDNMKSIINPQEINTTGGKPDDQKIKVCTSKMINLKYPIESLRNFLMHIKGKINIHYGDNIICVDYMGEGILLRTEIKSELNK